MPGKTIKEPCCICRATKDDGVKLGRYDNKVYCLRHLDQVRNHGKIISVSRLRGFLTTCCICGQPARSTKDGKEYCQKHYMQMYHHGEILPNTIFESNRYEDHPDEGYTICFTKDKNFNENGQVLIDLDKKELVHQHKVYLKRHGDKLYATISIEGKKYNLHRFLLNIHEEKYTIDRVVDHINGNPLDNRLSNLRICSHKDNMKNIRKKSSIVGVGWIKANKKWTARIMSNYKNIHIGNYDTYEEAVLARIEKEKELFGEFGPNKDLFYVLNLSSPIDELKEVLSDEA